MKPVCTTREPAGKWFAYKSRFPLYVRVLKIALKRIEMGVGTSKRISMRLNAILRLGNISSFLGLILRVFVDKVPK